MRLDMRADPITDDDAAIRAALDDVDIVPLLLAVAHATGDRCILREHLRPNPERWLMPDAGATAEQRTEARDLSAVALAAWRDRGCPPAPRPTDDELRRMFDFVAGGTVTDVHVPLLREELAMDGEDLRAPRWRKHDVAADRPFHVAVVGSGMSGIVVARRLQQAGVPFTVYEKNADVGGTWYENAYPGCRVDVPSHLYSFSFAQSREWPSRFSTQQVLLDYFRSCVDAFGLREAIRFGTEVLGADWDDDAQRWRLHLSTGDTAEADALVSAVGQLNRPSLPDIPGRDRYAGISFHSAQWDHSIDLTGRRVGIIGSGASAAQFIPAVAEQDAEVTVFQRTPPWLLPSSGYLDETPPGMRWLLCHVPAYANWDRVWQFWRTQEGLLPMAQVDPDWPDHTRSVGPMNDVIRELFSAYLASEFPDPGLYAKVQPKYPPLSKRFVRDDGAWGRTLRRPNVELNTEAIEAITEKGVRTADGVEHELDVLIYGTGFQASRFLTPMRVRGRGGVDIHERWDGDARAYLGITVPGFPNLFLMYGPNTNIVVNGSIIFFSECGAHYIVECIRLLLADDRRALDCKPDVHDAYNARIDVANRQRAWGAATVNTWYRNEKGRIAQNWPFALLDYWQQTRRPNPDDYDLT